MCKVWTEDDWKIYDFKRSLNHLKLTIFVGVIVEYIINNYVVAILAICGLDL